MADKDLTSEEKVGCGVAVAVGVIAAAAHGWNMRGFVDLGVAAFVALGFGAVTGVALGNIALGLMRRASGRSGLKYVVGGLVFGALGVAAPFFPVASDHILVDLPFGIPMLEDRQKRLEHAIDDEDVELTRRLARAGVGSREPRNAFGAPLFGATRNAEVLRAALEGGLDPDAADAKGFTRLMSPWSREIAEVLVEFGASPDIRGPEGRTPLIYAVMSDRPWAPLLIAASTDLRAADDTGQSAIDFTSPGSELTRLLQDKAGEPPLRRLQDTDTVLSYGRTDWLVAAEDSPVEPLKEPAEPFAGSQLTLDTPRLLRGDLVGLTLRLRNNTAEPLRLRVEGRISAAAYFVGGSHDVVISNPYRGQFIQEVRWPPLSLPAAAEGELRLKLLARAEDAGALDVRIDAVDSTRDLRTYFSLNREPSGDSPDIKVTGLGESDRRALSLTAVTALVLAALVWHFGAAKKRLFLLALVAVFALCGLIFSLSFQVLLEGIRAVRSYEETTCTVLDRRLFPHETIRANPGTTRSRTEITYFPMLALRYAADGQERISEGFATGMVNEGDLRDFRLGGQYPCWYDSENHRRIVVKRSLNPVWVGLLVSPLLVGLGALIVIIRELRHRKRDESPSPPFDRS
jgi:hypothetical protein